MGNVEEIVIREDSTILERMSSFFINEKLCQIQQKVSIEAPDIIILL